MKSREKFNFSFVHPQNHKHAEREAAGSAAGSRAAAHQDRADLRRPSEPVQVPGAAGVRPPPETCEYSPEDLDQVFLFPFKVPNQNQIIKKKPLSFSSLISHHSHHMLQKQMGWMMVEVIAVIYSSALSW